MSLTEEFRRMLLQASRQSRNDTLDAAIEVCEAFARTGHSAECCVQALKDLKSMMPAPPDQQN